MKKTMLLLFAIIPALLLAPPPAGAAKTPCEEAMAAFQATAVGSNGVMTAAIADALLHAVRACRDEGPSVHASDPIRTPFPDSQKFAPKIDVAHPIGCRSGVAYTAANAYVHLKVIMGPQITDFTTYSGEGEHMYKQDGLTWKHKFFGSHLGIYGLIAHDMSFGGAILIGGTSVPADSADARGNCGGKDYICEGQGIALWDHGFAMFADGYLNVCVA